MEIEDLISIAFIKNPIGNDGEVTVIPDMNFTGIFSYISEVFIVFPDNTVRFETIQSFKKNGERIRIKIRGVSDKSQAFILKNAKLMLAKEDIDSFLESNGLNDKIDGYKVFLKNDKLIGTVDYVFNNSVQEIISIKTLEGAEFMLPFVKQFIQKMDKKNKMIIINPPEGLLDAN
ncbi:MAG: ribosome maturation factor RimM [Candidatus Cloacimonadota bacterium]|nr:ribosome maturation factor RimM [Candidatus Cloacimonadota bacterium]